MNRRGKWKHIDTNDGLMTYRLHSWTHFFDFLEAEFFTHDIYSKRTYIWRGQRRADWSLSTTLDRLFGRLGQLTLGQSALSKLSSEHLAAFKYASRGRRGSNPAGLTEDEWWALGQHFGLATPLLDWTRSPFAAAYFTFEELSSDDTPFRVVYALDQGAVLAKRDEWNEGPSSENGVPIIELIEPLSDENQRLVSQGGCFTKVPIGIPIESWVAQSFEGSLEPILWRIEIPDLDRAMSLRALNRMNINHLSLFPDLSGASRSTNLRMELLL